MKKHFLSLTEMLVVVGIIILLFSIGVPAVIKGMQRGELTECKGNLSQLGKAVSVYLKDNQNYFPKVSGDAWIGSSTDPIALTIGDSYTTATVCPSDTDEADSYRAAADGDTSDQDLDLDSSSSKKGLKSSKVLRPEQMVLFTSRDLYSNASGNLTLESDIDDLSDWHGSDKSYPFVNVGGSVTSIKLTNGDLSNSNKTNRIDFKND